MRKAAARKSVCGRVHRGSALDSATACAGLSSDLSWPWRQCFLRRPRRRQHPRQRQRRRPPRLEAMCLCLLLWCRSFPGNRPTRKQSFFATMMAWGFGLSEDHALHDRRELTGCRSPLRVTKHLLLIHMSKNNKTSEKITCFFLGEAQAPQQASPAVDHHALALELAFRHCRTQQRTSLFSKMDFLNAPPRQPHSCCCS